MADADFFNWLRGYRAILAQVRTEAPQLQSDGRVTVLLVFPNVEVFHDWMSKRSDTKQMLALDEEDTDAAGVVN